ncbi:MAG: AEC family transporter [Devosiaceae bacterium]|nr:AEC family transporter [Devosiaceae bacterium MH13]
MSLLAIVLPVFGLIAIGFLAARTGLIKDSVGDGLSDFVFTVAVPCLLFKTLATADVPEASPWAYWAVYFLAVIVVWTAAHLAVTRVFGRDRATGTVGGFSSAQANTVLIGIPLILTSFGEAGRVPIFLLIAIHLPIMMTAATVSIELGGAQGARWQEVARKLAVSILTHPIIIGILAGLAWRFSGLTIPAIPFQILEMLGSTAVPCALFSAGMALKRYGVAGDVRVTVVVSFLKLLVHPALVFALGTYVFALPPVWLGAAVLFAACPSGINAYLLANRYGTGIRIASSSIAVSTGLAVVSVTFWLWVLDTYGPGLPV